jgi:AcrR family transcriptional regulator
MAASRDIDAPGTSPGDRQPRQPRRPLEVRRQQVLDAALDLIVDRGFAGATMEAIARHAGLAKPVVYNAYRRLDPLLSALIERENARALAPLLAPLEDEEMIARDPQAVLGAWLERMVNAILADQPLWRLVLMPPEGAPPVLQAAVRDGREAARLRLVELITPVQQSQPRLAGLDPYWLAHAMLAVCEHFARQLLDDPAEFTPERIHAFARNMLGAVLG